MVVGSKFELCMAGLWLGIVGLMGWQAYKSILAERPNTEVYDSLSEVIQVILSENSTSCQPFAHYEVSGPVGYRDPVFTHIVADLYYCSDPKEVARVRHFLDSKGFSTYGTHYVGSMIDLPEHYFEEFSDVRDNLIFVYGESTP